MLLSVNSIRNVSDVRIQDTLSGEIRRLESREAGQVGIYACGPTVYRRIHIGNARPFVIFTLLRRFLAHEGLDAKLVINVTDINDKIYDAAREAGEPSAEFAKRDDPRLRRGHRRGSASAVPTPSRSPRRRSRRSSP